MGQEVACNVCFNEQVSAGTAQLETDDLCFRGEVRLKIPLAEMQSVEARDGVLTVAYSQGVARFEVGARAEKWAESIRNPRRLIDKLDVKPGLRVAVLGVSDPTFDAQLAERAPDALRADTLPPGDPFDLLFLAAESHPALDAIPTLVPRLRATGALWIVAPKGQRHLTERDVLTAGRAAGLTDTKVARFSATHTAHKFVIPRARRASLPQ